MHERIGVPSVETRSSWIIATVLLVILALSFGAPWITIVALKLIAAESDGLRAVPSLATSLAWLGYGESKTYYHTIAEYQALKGSARDHRMRLAGTVAPGSIRRAAGHWCA